MASWAARRQALYITTSLGVFLLVAGYLGFLIFSRPPSCFNGIKDGTELAIDCGGSCSRMCSQQVRPPVVLWTRVLPLAPSSYTAVAYVENDNVGAYVKSVRYTVKLFDASNVLIAERQGTAAIAPTRTTPIIEANIQTGNRVPARAFLEFIDDPQWDKVAAVPAIRVDGQNLDASGQRLDAVVHNDDALPVVNLPVTAVLFDANGTAQAASVSVIPRIDRASQAPVVFTWPLAPLSPVVRAEVIALPMPR